MPKKKKPDAGSPVEGLGDYPDPKFQAGREQKTFRHVNTKVVKEPKWRGSKA